MTNLVQNSNIKGLDVIRNAMDGTKVRVSKRNCDNCDRELSLYGTKIRGTKNRRSSIYCTYCGHSNEDYFR